MKKMLFRSLAVGAVVSGVGFSGMALAKSNPDVSISEISKELYAETMKATNNNDIELGEIQITAIKDVSVEKDKTWTLTLTAPTGYEVEVDENALKDAVKKADNTAWVTPKDGKSGLTFTSNPGAKVTISGKASADVVKGKLLPISLKLADGSGKLSTPGTTVKIAAELKGSAAKDTPKGSIKVESTQGVNFGWDRVKKDDDGEVIGRETSTTQYSNEVELDFNASPMFSKFEKNDPLKIEEKLALIRVPYYTNNLHEEDDKNNSAQDSIVTFKITSNSGEFPGLDNEMFLDLDGNGKKDGDDVAFTINSTEGTATAQIILSKMDGNSFYVAYPIKGDKELELDTTFSMDGSIAPDANTANVLHFSPLVDGGTTRNWLTFAPNSDRVATVPFYQQADQWHCRTYFANRSNKDAKYVVRMINEEGTTTELTEQGITGTLPGKQSVLNKCSDFFTTTEGFARGSFRIYFFGSNDITGTYQLINVNTGAVTNQGI